jgi:hypothetical protein
LQRQSLRFDRGQAVRQLPYPSGSTRTAVPYASTSLIPTPISVAS